MHPTPESVALPADAGLPSAASVSAWLLQKAQTAAGKLVMLACFCVLLRLHGEAAFTLTALLAMTTFLPAQRRALVALGTLLYAWKLVPDAALFAVAKAEGLQGAFAARWLFPAQLMLTLGLCAAYARLVAARPHSVLATRPITMLIAFHVALLAFASSGVLGGMPQLWLWGCAAGLTHYLWFLGYTLKDKAATDAKNGRELLLQAGAFAPFWSPSLTPFPKGASHLRKIEAKTPEALALCQLKALRLAAWALVLYALSETWNAVLHGPSASAVPLHASSLASFSHLLFAHLPAFGLPTYDAALSASAAGTPFSAGENWAALVSAFIGKLLRLSVFGHVIVATCRMAGFAALRNTYSPLRSRSLADFWNRVYYYFKELLVEFFFYPTFFRYFRTRPRLRLFCATLAAAGFGNFVYHYFSRFDEIQARGVLGQLVAMQSYALYALILSVSIAISQLRAQTKKAAPSRAARAGTLGFVLGFYCLLTILDEAGAHSVAECVGFASNLLKGA